jgi:TolA-binding protein
VIRKLLFSFFISSSLIGCLKTRTEVKETETKQVMAQQVTTLQKTNADTSNRIAELEQEVRELNGKIEVIENKLSKQNPEHEKSLKGVTELISDSNKKMAAYQEELLKQDNAIKQLNQEIETLKTEKAKAAEKVEKKDPHQLAEDYFKQSDWKKAIIQYQKYRDENPKGKKVADSTYKIAYSFSELGMKEEAKTFYEEVVSKFPGSPEAKKAKSKIKGFKK